jgi:O-succinylbenzoate synthase
MLLQPCRLPEYSHHERLVDHSSAMILDRSNKPLISLYRMRSRGFLNSVSSRRVFEGALIRDGDGYGCIHPWPELGDPPLDKCLADLQGERRWPIVRRALRCAEYDAAARQREESLFEEMEVPESHATLISGDHADIEAAVAAGFSMVKLKRGRDLEREARALEDAAASFPQLRWRLDFNEVPDLATVTKFLQSLTPSTRAAIDYIEDPCPFAEGAWEELHRKTRLPLAVDREAAPHRQAAQVTVIKPAIDEPYLLGEAAIAHRQRVVVTSYMDHPFGQAFAAWEAARLELQFPGLVGVCGLQTHHLFEVEGVPIHGGPWSPTFRVPEGTGLGFDDYLDSLPWTRLY